MVSSRKAIAALLCLSLTGCFASWTDDGATIEPMLNTNLCVLALCIIHAKDTTDSDDETIIEEDDK